VPITLKKEDWVFRLKFNFSVSKIDFQRQLCTDHGVGGLAEQARKAVT